MRSSDPAPHPTARSGFRLAMRLHWPVLFLSVSLGLLMAAVWELRRDPAYEAAAWVAMRPSAEIWEGAASLPRLRPASASPIRQIESSIDSELFLRSALGEEGGPGVLDGAAALRDLRSRLRIEPIDIARPDSGFRLVARHSQPDGAARLADRLAEALIERDEAAAEAVRAAELGRLEEELALCRERAEGLEAALAERREASASQEQGDSPLGDSTPALRQLRRDLVAENHLAQSLEAKILAARTESAAAASSMEVVRQAGSVEAGLVWQPWRSLALGSLLGGLAGIGLVRAFGVRRLARTLAERYAVAPGAKLTALLPLPEVNAGPAEVSAGGSLAPYRALRFHLGRLPASRCLTLAIHPAGPQSPCDEVVAHLAPVLASGGHSTIVVDADPLRSRLHEAFSAGRHPGLADYLSGEMRLEETVVRLPQQNLWFLPSGRPLDEFGELLAGKRMSDLIDELRSRFDYVLVLSPSIRERIEAALLCARADHVLAVADVHSDAPAALRRTCGALEAYDSRVSGLLLAHRLRLSEATLPLPPQAHPQAHPRQRRAGAEPSRDGIAMPSAPAEAALPRR